MSGDWLTMSTCDLGREIGAGNIDPVELAERFLSAIQSHSCAESIYARVTAERAMAEAEAASERARRGLRLSPLDGVPISWKDLYDTAGVATEAGSALLRGRTPKKDAEVLRRATGFGLVCLGKTHTTELAFSGLGLNPVTATPSCINDPEAVAGGSSSGAAASVANGLAAAGIGSDTGGSVRVPAAWNDLVGLKTTFGLLPLDGVVPLCSRFDTVGPLTRTVEDAAAVLSALSACARVANIGGARAGALRLLILEEGLVSLREQPRRGFEQAIGRLRDAGATILSASVKSVAKALPLSGCLYGVEAYGRWADTIEDDPDVMFVEIRDRFRSGGSYSGTEYVKAWNILHELRAEYRAAVAGFDAVLLPTSPILPPKQKALLEDRELHARENLLALSNTRIGNLMEVPALTLPTGVPSTGLTMLGQANEEVRLLRAGRAVESAIAG